VRLWAGFISHRTAASDGIFCTQFRKILEFPSVTSQEGLIRLITLGNFVNLLQEFYIKNSSESKETLLVRYFNSVLFNKRYDTAI
jgi:hypothetical protein